MDIYVEFFIKLIYGFFLLFYTTLFALARLIIPAKYRSKNINGEKVLITGSGSGIGRLMAIKLAKLGAKLILVDIDKDSNENTANQVMLNGGYAKTYTCDLSNKENIYQVCDQIKKEVGEINILINNAGIVTGKKFLESSDSSNEKTFQVNVFSHFWLCKAFLPSMIEKNHGHVVTIASIAGLLGTTGLCDYCASKFAAVGFDEALRDELARIGKHGVKTTVVCPYYINTGMFDGVPSGILDLLDPDYVVEKIVEAILTNQKVLYLPRLMYFLVALKGIVTNEYYDFASLSLFKTSQLMDNFVGRKNSSKNK